MFDTFLRNLFDALDIFFWSKAQGIPDGHDSDYDLFV